MYSLILLSKKLCRSCQPGWIVPGAGRLCYLWSKWIKQFISIHLALVILFVILLKHIVPCLRWEMNASFRRPINPRPSPCKCTPWWWRVSNPLHPIVRCSIHFCFFLDLHLLRFIIVEVHAYETRMRYPFEALKKVQARTALMIKREMPKGWQSICGPLELEG